MSNKRIRKKHYWLGSKRAGTNLCRCVIGNGIRRRYEKATGIEPKRRNIMRYLRWFYIHSSQNEWDDAVINWQPMPSANIESLYGDKSVLKGIEHLLKGGK